MSIMTSFKCIFSKRYLSANSVEYKSQWYIQGIEKVSLMKFEKSEKLSIMQVEIAVIYVYMKLFFLLDTIGIIYNN